MKHPLVTALLSSSLLVSAPTMARQVTVEVTNMTNAAYFTPLLVAVHDGYTRLFEAGSPASGALQAMAEGGDISGLVAEVEAGGGVVVEDSVDGLLAPGQSSIATIDVRPRQRRHLSVTAMVLPTNDGFIGLNGIRIPLRRGVYHYDVPVYDAGTEANDELITGGGAPGAAGIPADPGGHAGISGSGVAGADSNPNVHIHRGIVGDLDPVGGRSDLDAGVHRWLNPAARITITVGR